MRVGAGEITDFQLYAERLEFFEGGDVCIVNGNRGRHRTLALPACIWPMLILVIGTPPLTSASASAGEATMTRIH